MKVLALDYGSARTGVAVCDPSGTLARPLETIERARTADAGDVKVQLDNQNHEADIKLPARYSRFSRASAAPGSAKALGIG